VRAALDERRGDWIAVAKACRVSHSWISKFVRGQIGNPGYATLKRLHAELIAADAGPPVERAATTKEPV
jgi:transcriptional regulator with XRE-family HTH domain